MDPQSQPAPATRPPSQPAPGRESERERVLALDPGRGPDRPLTVVVAPDSFKGSLSSVAVARAIADGWLAARPEDGVLLAPLADGGEGTLEAVAAAGGWEWRRATVLDPLRRPIEARWLLSADRRTAVVEMAEASGLSRVDPGERDPLGASTIGTGQLVAAALAGGVEELVLGIGGSATTDGGAGFLEALGARVDLAAGRVDLASLDPALARLAVRVACDVTNPLLGPAGAAATYGPQKGATPELVAVLDARLARWADALEAAAGRRERDTPGAGAAGGLGFALLCLRDRFRSFALRPGVELVMEATGFEAKLGRADLAITGEGRVDEQTAYGKTALGVARRAASAGVPCLAVAGGATPGGIDALAAFGTIVVPVVERPMPVEEAMAEGEAPIRRCGERIGRLVSLGARLVSLEAGAPATGDHVTDASPMAR